jgi:hypothetical protein
VQDKRKMLMFFARCVEQREYAEQFAAGHLYMSALRTFKDWVRGVGPEGRGDRREGASGWFQPSDITVRIAGIEIPGSDMAGPLIIQPNDHDWTNVLCVYRGTPEDLVELDGSPLRRRVRTPEACMRMGPWCVYIANPTEFARRVDTAVRTRGYGMRRGAVTYFDSATFSGDIENPLFSKGDAYAWQREYRFAVTTRAPLDAAPRELILEVGDLSDICVVLPTFQLSRVVLEFAPG